MVCVGNIGVRSCNHAFCYNEGQECIQILPFTMPTHRSANGRELPAITALCQRQLSENARVCTPTRTVAFLKYFIHPNQDIALAVYRGVQ